MSFIYSRTRPCNQVLFGSYGRLSMSLFRYGLDYVQMAIQRLIGFGKKEEFKEILAILRRQNPDRIRVL
ncbi:hypothetical protein BFX08_17720 [Acinetobacter baumannii]|nr:hypothetical protein BFX08_17720 [Acinetobacter baumannii]